MKFMNIYPTLSEDQNTTEGLHTIFVYANNVTDGVFSYMLLFSLFVVAMLGSFYSQERLKGQGDFPASFAVAGYLTTGAAFILSLIPGMINTATIVIVVAVSIVGTIWLFFSRG